MSNLRCCGCNEEMTRTPQDGVWKCVACTAAATTFAVAESRCEARLYQQFLERARSAPLGERGCPSCARVMHLVSSAESQPFIELDLCWGCRLFWFDPGELDSLPAARRLSPKGAALSDALSRQLASDRPDSRVADVLRHPVSGSLGELGLVMVLLDTVLDLATSVFGGEC